MGSNLGLADYICFRTIIGTGGERDGGIGREGRDREGSEVGRRTIIGTGGERDGGERDGGRERRGRERRGEREGERGARLVSGPL